MWPMLLDYSRDDCVRILRRMELEAYSSLVSTLRAQGELSKDKKKLLQELASTLSISLERHQAEVRRAVNDEKLNTIAHNISGPDTSTEWAAEGRRLIPLIPRLVPQTAFYGVANAAAGVQANKNVAMPAPAATGAKQPPPEPIHRPEPGVIKRKRIDSSQINLTTPSAVRQTSIPVPQQRKVQSPASPITSPVNRPTLFAQSKTTPLNTGVKVSVSSMSTMVSSSPSGPRVIFVSSSNPGAQGLTSLSSGNILTPFTSAIMSSPGSSTVSQTNVSRPYLTTTGETTYGKQIRTMVKSNVFPMNCVATGSSFGQPLMAQSPGTRIFTTKSGGSQQVVVFPANPQQGQKTIAIPVSQALKTLQVAGSPNLIYQQNPSVKGTITIQTFKPTGVSGINKTPNLIIMPATKAPLTPTSRTITLGTASKSSFTTKAGTIRLPKETMVLNTEQLKRKCAPRDQEKKFEDSLSSSSTSTASKEGTSERTIKKPTPGITINPGNVIEIQASGEALQNLVKSGQLSQDIIDLVQKAVNIAGIQQESLAPPSASASTSSTSSAPETLQQTTDR